jgi:hypothetical protein
MNSSSHEMTILVSDGATQARSHKPNSAELPWDLEERDSGEVEEFSSIDEMKRANHQSTNLSRSTQLSTASDYHQAAVNVQVFPL